MGVSVLGLVAAGVAGLLGAAVALGLWVHARDEAQMHAVWTALEAAGAAADVARYDPAMVAGLPEVAQRYFARAIEPGTPLRRVVRLQMEGTFIMSGNQMPMTARQILAAPALGFVWQADIGAGLMRFAGSDGYHASPGGVAESWTKFWLRGIEPMQLRLDAAGNPTQVWALRWTDANPEKVHRLQPFGGRMLAMARHQGFLIPTEVELGNMWGTPEYAPFFLARITRAEF